MVSPRHLSVGCVCARASVRARACARARCQRVRTPAPLNNNIFILMNNNIFILMNNNIFILMNNNIFILIRRHLEVGAELEGPALALLLVFFDDNIK